LRGRCATRVDSVPTNDTNTNKMITKWVAEGGAEIQYNSKLDFTPKILKVYENDGVKR